LNNYTFLKNILEVIYLQSKIRQEKILLDQLLDEAFKLTGNKRDSQPKTSVTARWILEQDGGLVVIYLIY
jgi:hypothetical protein